MILPPAEESQLADAIAKYVEAPGGSGWIWSLCLQDACLGRYHPSPRSRCVRCDAAAGGMAGEAMAILITSRQLRRELDWRTARKARRCWRDRRTLTSWWRCAR